MRILLTNDDGILAAGILALEAGLLETGSEVMVAAPDEERSASSHSVSLRRPLKVSVITPDRLAVSGTPVDSVNIAINHFFKERRPDLVISGINKGANLGCDIHYSGTVAAAREAVMLGIPALAISLETFREEPDFGPAARFAGFMARFILEHGLPARTFLNVNLPDLPEASIKGLRATIQGLRQYANEVRKDADENGRDCYWLGTMPQGGHALPDSDIVAVAEGYISVTPLRLDLTAEDALLWLQEGLAGGDHRPWK